MSDKPTTTRCDGMCARCDGAGTIPDWSSGRLPCPACKPMEGSEATTAGAIRQSSESEVVSESCPWCDRPLHEVWGGYECGSGWNVRGELKQSDLCKWIVELHRQLEHARTEARGWYARCDRFESEAAKLRVQLEQAQERAEQLQRQIDEDDDKWTRYNDLYVEARGEVVDLQRRNAQLRRVLERQADAMGAYQLHLAECEDCQTGEPCLEEDRLFAAMSDVDREVVAVLADAPANPLAHFTDGQLYDELRRRGWKAATWAEEEGSRDPGGAG